MRIIILGAGRVGESVAESLVSERNDITVIDPDPDPDPQRLRELEERLDLRGVPGNGIHAEVMRRAGGEDADMLIACASLDETNLVACKIAHDVFRIPSTIARLRAADLKEGDALLGKDGFAVDHVICPEESVVRYVQKLIDYPEALQVLEFSGGRALLVAVRAAPGSPVVNHTIREFRELFPDAPMRLVALYRQEKLLGCEGDTRILPGDEIFLLADSHKIRHVLRAMHRSDGPVRRVMIAGGRQGRPAARAPPRGPVPGEGAGTRPEALRIPAPPASAPPPSTWSRWPPPRATRPPTTRCGRCSRRC